VLAGMTQTSRELARRVLLRLVTPERTRDIVELSDVLELGDRTEVRTVVDHLVAARLLALRSAGNASTVELVHESLLDRWPTLRHWLEQTQDDAAFLARLRIAAKQWDDGGRSPGLLWRTDAEQDARRFARSYRGELPRRERAYLDAVFALGDRATRTRRWAVAGTIGVLGMLVVAAVVALLWIRSAESEAVHEAERAREEADRARAANEQLQAEKTRQAELLDRLRQETAARDAARIAKDAATQQVEHGKVQLERTNDQLRGALVRANTQSKRAVDESERARAEAERAIALKKLADEERMRAEDLARKERERADRRGKINTSLR
jgi:eukaryotic-like serine/threonine-protein kinase